MKPPKPPAPVKLGKLPTIKPFPGTKVVRSSYGMPQPGRVRAPSRPGGLARSLAAAPKPAAQPRPAAQPQAPGAQGSPLDATYFADTKANDFKVNNSVNALNLTGAADQTALQATLGQLAYAQPRAELALEQKANLGNGLYSSVYQQNLGNLNQQYLSKQNAAQTKYATQMDAIAGKIAALEGDVPLYDAQQALASVGRATNLAAKNPALGGTAASTPPVTNRKTVVRAPNLNPHRSFRGKGRLATVIAKQHPTLGQLRGKKVRPL